VGLTNGDGGLLNNVRRQQDYISELQSIEIVP
jgi:hypothetical protein